MEVPLTGGGGDEQRHVAPMCARSHMPTFISPQRPLKKFGLVAINTRDGETQAGDGGGVGGCIL